MVHNKFLTPVSVVYGICNADLIMVEVVLCGVLYLFVSVAEKDLTLLRRRGSGNSRRKKIIDVANPSNDVFLKCAARILSNSISEVVLHRMV